MAESLMERHHRLHAEAEALRLEAPKLERQITSVEREIDAAARRDDQSEIGRLMKRRSDLRAKLEGHAEVVRLKALAVSQAEADHRAAVRAEGIHELIAYAKTAADISPQIDAALEALADALGRFRGQTDGAYRVATDKLGEDWRGVAAMTSSDRTHEDLLWHLAGALGRPRHHLPRGTAVEQAQDLLRWAESLR